MARGYDQAERIAFYLARELGVPRVACLQRRDQSRSLAALPSRAHRSRADAGFVPLAHSQQGPVWLVDDVITTGTTLRTVERLLQQSGVEVERRITAVKAFSRPGSRSEYQGSDEANDGAYKDLRIRMTEEGF